MTVASADLTRAKPNVHGSVQRRGTGGGIEESTQKGNESILVFSLDSRVVLPVSI